MKREAVQTERDRISRVSYYFVLTFVILNFDEFGDLLEAYLL